MSNILKKTEDITKLPECWIYKGDTYRYSRGNLPLLPKKYEEVLKKFEIPYRSVFISEEKERLEYWDKNIYVEKETTLPTYEYVFGSYQYVGEHTGKIFDQETIVQANKVGQKVWKDIKRIEYEKKVVYLEKVLGKKSSKYISKYDLKDVEFNKDEVIKTEYNLFYIFIIRRLDGSKTGHILLFNKSRIVGKTVEIRVPKEYAKYIIGKGGCNCKKIAQTMKIKKVEVKS